MGGDLLFELEGQPLGRDLVARHRLGRDDEVALLELAAGVLVLAERQVLVDGQ
nr:hypothetical protein GCM10020241_52460 [Streptoalloteichus tenebrarius]